MGNYTNLAISLIILIAIIVLRKDISKLVNWIISFRKITKHEKGISLEGYKELGKPKEIEANLIEQEDETCKEIGDTNSNKTWIELLFAKQYDESIKTIEKLTQNSDEEERRIELECCKGHVLFTKDFKVGIEYFNNLIEKYPDNQNPYRWFGISYYWNSKYEECLEIIDKGLENSKEISGLISVKSNCLSSMGKNEEAINLLISSIENKTDGPFQYQKLCELIKVDLEAKYIWFKKGIKKYPDDKSLKEDFASFLSNNQKYDEVVLQYKDLLNIDSQNTRYLTLLANAYLNLGLNNIALETYIKANEIANSEEGWILANIGNIYNNQGFYSEGISYLKKALEIEQDSEYSHDRLASAIRHQKEENEKLNQIIQAAHAVSKFKIED